MGLVALSVASCDVGGDSESRVPMAIRVTPGGDVEFVLCTTRQIESVGADYAATPGQWETFWDFTGSVAIRADTPVDEAVLRSEFSGDATRPEFKGGGAILIALDGPSSNDSLLGVYLLPEGADGAMWIQSDESQTETPC